MAAAIAMQGLMPTPALADTSVQAIALFNGKAMLSVNGHKAKIIAAGDAYKGVKLIESSTEQAIIEVDGQRETLVLSSTVQLTKSLATKPAEPDGGTVQIWADGNGFFRSDGAINGEPLEFLVDTGANLVVLNSRHADRIGLEYQDGLQTFAVTASGNTPMYVIEVEQISIEGIVLRNIQAGVIVGGYPLVPLLGMSFLEQLNMNRVGNVMELKKGF